MKRSTICYDAKKYDLYDLLLATARVKPIARERARLTKRIRQFPAGKATAGGKPPSAEGEEKEEDGLVTGPLYSMMKQLIEVSGKKTPPTITPKRDKTSEAATAGPSSSTPKRKTPSERLEDLQKRGAAIRKEFVENAEKLKKRKTEAERLKPLSGWEDWAKGKTLRRKLDYREDND